MWKNHWHSTIRCHSDDDCGEKWAEHWKNITRVSLPSWIASKLTTERYFISKVNQPLIFRQIGINTIIKESHFQATKSTIYCYTNCDCVAGREKKKMPISWYLQNKCVCVHKRMWYLCMLKSCGYRLWFVWRIKYQILCPFIYICYALCHMQKTKEPHTHAHSRVCKCMCV